MIGVKEGLFKKAGVDVKYTVVEDPVQRFNALKSRQPGRDRDDA